MQPDILSTKEFVVAGSWVGSASPRWWFALFYFVVMGPNPLTFYVTPQGSINKLASEVAATAKSMAAMDEFVSILGILFVWSTFGTPKSDHDRFINSDAGGERILQQARRRYNQSLHNFLKMNSHFGVCARKIHYTKEKQLERWPGCPD